MQDHGIYFYVANNKLSCMWQQRSVGTFLGLPFNIASYALLTHMFAQQCDLEVGELIFTVGDTHLYLNHIEQAKLLLQRDPKSLPILSLKRKPENMYDYCFQDFEFIGYEPYPAIKADVSI